MAYIFRAYICLILANAERVPNVTAPDVGASSLGTHTRLSYTLCGSRLFFLGKGISSKARVDDRIK